MHTGFGMITTSSERNEVTKPKFQMGMLPRSISYQSSASSRHSSFTLPSSLGSPVFDFPTFDELFENQGKTTLTIHKSETSYGDSLPIRSVRTSFDAFHSSGFSKNNLHDMRRLLQNQQENICTETKKLGPESNAKISFAVSIQKAYEEQERAHHKPLKRVDSIMVQSMSDLVYQSWESSRSFVGFRNKVGRYFYHKHCAWCKLDSMPFVFTHVMVGMFLVSAGVLGLVNCLEEYIVNSYAIANGFLSVFLFPTLLMSWSKRVGGCVNESEKEQMGRGLFWITTLIIRIVTSAAGTFLLWYRYTYYQAIWSSWICQMTFYACVYCVIGEWAFLFFLFLLPTFVFCAVRCLAPRIV